MAMTTPTPIETFEDILAAMENNPRLQAAIRQHILDQEFLQLPAIVRELQQAVAQLTQLVHDYIAATDARLGQIEARLERIEGDVEELKTGQARLEGDVMELKTGQARLEAGQAKLENDVTELKTGQARLQGQFNQFRGESYEIRVQSQAVSYSIIQMGFSNPHVSRPVNAGNAPQFNSVLQQALSNDAITKEQAMDLCNADLIISGDDNQHLVAEISITVSATDIERAVRRAGIMQTATNGVCTPAIIAQSIPASQSAEAAANGVAAMLFT